MQSLLKKNGIYSSAYYLISIALPLVLAPYASRILGVNGIGEVAYAQAIFIYFQLLAGLGSGTYGQRLVAQKSLKKRDLSLAFLEIWLLKIVLGFTGIIIFVFAIEGLNLPLKLLLYVQIVDLAINFVDISWLYYGMQNFKTVIIRQLGIKLFTVLLVFIFVKSDQDGFKYLLCFSVPTFFGYLLMWVNIHKLIDFNLIKKIRPFKHLKGLTVMFIPYVAILLFAHIDKFLIGYLTNTTEVGLYDMSLKFVALSIGLSVAVSSVLMPNIATAYADKQISYINNTLSRVLEISIFLGSLAFLWLYFVLPLIIPWFLSDQFIDSIDIVKILSFIAFLKSLTVLLGSGFMIAIQREGPYIVMIWISLVINVSLNLFFIPKFGANGAAIASVISEVFLMICLIMAVKSFLIKNFYFGLTKYISALALVFLIFKMINVFLIPSVISMLVMGSLVSALYCITIFFIFKQQFVFKMIANYISDRGKND